MMSIFVNMQIVVLDCASPIVQVFTGHSGPVRCGAFTPDGKQVVTGGGEGDNSLKIWDPKTGVCALSVMDAHSYHTAGLLFHPRNIVHEILL